MKKYWRILPAMMIISILCSSSGFVHYAKPAEAATDEELVIYVSPDGDDNGDGTLGNMLKTPAGAQSYVRRSGALGNRPVRVVFKPGTYYIDEGLVFDARDAGNERNPVVWESEEKWAAHFYGSTPLDNSLFETVTDTDILARLPESARGKVLQLDLKKMNIDLDHAYPHGWIGGTEIQPYVDLIRNGKKQMISRWPNGTNQYVFWDKVLNKGTDKQRLFGSEHGATIQFSNPRLSRWTEAKYAWIRGHIGVVWAVDHVSVESVDVEKSTIKFNTTPSYPFSDSSPRELQIFNLLEEIDTATEWFIDVDTDILYYYPPSKIDDNTQLELTTLNDDMFTFKSGVDIHMTLRGFDLSRTRRSIAYVRSNYLTIDNCSITYSKGFLAIELQADNYTITNNYFAFHDGGSVSLAGDDNLLKQDFPGRGVFKNNYCYVNGYSKVTGGHAIKLNASCADIENNTVHNMFFGAVTADPKTRDCNIAMNEFYNFGKDIADAGGFYSGKSGAEINNQIAYNFIYDYHPVNKNIGNALQGIYFDDGLSFGIAHHNILVNGEGHGIQVGGGDNNVIESNIVLRMGGGKPFVTDNRREFWSTGQGMIDTVNEDVKTALRKFPYFSKTQPFLNHFLLKEPHLYPDGNVITNNLSDMEFEINENMFKNGKVFDNYTVEDESHFVDPDNYDFRIKDDSIFASKIPELTESNFDLYSVGCSLDVTEKVDKSFNLLYPNDGEKFNSVSELLVWEEAAMADIYEVIVATDKEMKNVVSKQTAHYNSISVEGLEDGKEYWWTVVAKNTSFKRKSTWTVKAPQKFVNTVNYIESAVNILHKVEANKKVLAENDLSLFGKEQTEALKATNKKAMNIYENALKTGLLYKEDYDAIIAELESAMRKFEKSEKLNFVHLKKEFLTNPDAWVLNRVGATVTDEGLVLERDPQKTGSDNASLKEIPGVNDIIQFRAKVDYKSNSAFVSFDLRRAGTEKAGWSDKRSMMVIIKKDIIELQIYPNLAIVHTVNNVWNTDGQWHDYAIGVVNKEDGARIIFTIDGEIAVDYRYYGSLLVNPGYFAVLCNNVKVTMAESQMGALETDPTVTNYFVNGGRHSENGIWTNAEAKGLCDTIIRKSDSGTATWTIDKVGGKKKVYFRKVVAADGDKNAKVVINSNRIAGQEGDESTKTYTIDLSSGEDEWILIDEGLFISGTVEVTLSGSGNGALYASAVRIEDVEE